MRTLNEQIQRLRDVLVTCYNAIKRKGGEIPEEGLRNMSNLPAAVLSIPQTHGVLTELEVTANGEYLPEEGADGFSKVMVVVESDPNIRVADGCYYEDGSRIEYGMSLANIICSSISDVITELVDNATGWVMTKALRDFPKLLRVVLGCKQWKESVDRLNPMLSGLTEVKEVIADELEYIPDDAIANRTECSLLKGLTSCEVVSLRALKRAKIAYPTGGARTCFFLNMPSLKVVHLDGIEYINIFRVGGSSFSILFTSHDSLEELHLGSLDSKNQAINLSNQTALGLIEIKGCAGNFDLSTWSPTTFLSVDLNKFLYNFQTYIADRVADMTGKTALTLTLSSAVYAALEAQEGQTILATLANKNWNVAQA